MMKKFLGFLAVVVIVAVILLLIFGNGLGLGFGNGLGFGSETRTTESADDAVDNEVAEPDVPEDSRGISEDETLPDLITVTIREDKVYVEDKEISDAEELRAYIEEINNDTREYKLVDENSIRDTYEWVVEVFDELKIKLVTE